MVLSVLTIICGSCSLSFIFFGAFLLWKPPKEINSVYGYRTKRSRLSQRNWDFAQGESARQFIKCGVILLVFAIAGLNDPFSQTLQIVFGLTAVITFSLVPYFATQRKLKNLDRP